MGIHKLKDVQCKNAACITGTVRKLADGGGLFLFVTKDGAKRWRYRYMVQGINRKGETALIEKLLSVGVYPDTTLADARVKAAELREQPDPGAARKAIKRAETEAAGNSFESVTRAWHARQRHWTKKYSRNVLARFEHYAFPAIGTRPISQISRGELASVLEAIEQKGSAALVLRFAPVISRVFRYALAKGLAEHNPLADLSLRDLIGKAEKRKQPAVSLEELPALLRAIDTYENRQVRLALQLIFLLFTRANEMLMGTWSEIDLDDALWRIPESRMKKRLPLLVPLSTQAIAILKELKEINCDSPMVFPGRSYEVPLSSNALLTAFKVMGYGGKQSTHGIRRIASTIINDAADAEDRPLFSGDAVERQLAHVPESIRATYNEAEYLPQRRRMMQWWSDFLDETAKKGMADNETV
jgi:integrase